MKMTGMESLFSKVSPTKLMLQMFFPEFGEGFSEQLIIENPWASASNVTSFSSWYFCSEPIIKQLWNC